MNTNPQQPSEASLRDIDIHDLLPQQEPFVMIGRLTHFDTVRTVTETDITTGNIFADDGQFSASGLIENIAQTCAARIGYINKYVLKKGIQLGFIAAVRHLEVLELPKVGDTITTTVEVKQELLGMTLAEAQVTCGDKLLVKTEIKIGVKEAS
jgi:predicted hotdog family 3-hydroxylacyl-ACP dehydratase